jgi:hypothetical protein
MSLCIWTSLHLNLPEHKKEHLQKYRKLGWMMLGLIALEMVVWNAWEQRKKMKEVSKSMQKKGFMPVRPTPWIRVRDEITKVWHWMLACLLLKAKDWPELADPTPYRPYNGRIHPWTDVHSWLVVMGGLSFEDSAEEDQQFMPENRQRMNVTVQNFAFLLEMRDHLIPDISREMIQDKSKSDGLAKLLTCWQAGYFCIQCVYRLSQQLSVTLLGLNVFAHALCALALFVIWSDKPRDVCEPTLIVGEEALDICAIFCLHDIDRSNWRSSLGYRITTPPDHPEKTLEISGPTSFSCSYDSIDRVLRYGALRDDSIKVLETHWYLEGGLKVGSNVTQVTLNARDLKRLQRVSKLVQGERSRSLGPPRIGPGSLPSVQKRCSLARVRNWSLDIENTFSFMIGDDYSAPRYYGYPWLRFVTGLTLAGACYGGLHLAAWNTPFASRAEALLWRVACVSIMTPGPMCVLAACLHSISKNEYVFDRYEQWHMVNGILWPRSRL